MDCLPNEIGVKFKVNSIARVQIKPLKQRANRKRVGWGKKEI